jgi:hypothetical protein
MSQQKKKSTFLKREVKFGGKTVILYSIDGNTWSTRKDELQAIIDRHEAEKVTFGEIKGGLGAGAKAAAAAKKDEADKAAKAAKPLIPLEGEIDELDLVEEEIVDEVEDDIENEDKVPDKRGRPGIVVAKNPTPASKVVAAKAKHLKSVAKETTAVASKSKAGKTVEKKKEVAKSKVAAPKTRASSAPAKSKAKTKSKRAAA